MLRRCMLALGLFVPLLMTGSPQPAVTSVEAVVLTVSDLDRSVDFYGRVLGFEKDGEHEGLGEAADRLYGIFGVHVRSARMRLGRESIELTEFLSPAGRPAPADSRSNDRWFQHVAIIVSDMDRAYARLREHRVRHVSPGPQRLPDWNPNAGGIRAFYFRDPDGHPLEILQFPEDKGDRKWRDARGRLFLGIDHTAIVVSDTEASLRFYRDTLGMRVVGESENYGPEQERLNNVIGARLRITALRAAAGPGVELLEYMRPRDGRPYPQDARPNDLLHWHTRVRVANAGSVERTFHNDSRRRASIGSEPSAEQGGRHFRSALVRDPDGHAVQVVQ